VFLLLARERAGYRVRRDKPAGLARPSWADAFPPPRVAVVNAAVAGILHHLFAHGTFNARVR
jgi:hypothetical protein